MLRPLGGDGYRGIIAVDSAFRPPGCDPHRGDDDMSARSPAGIHLFPLRPLLGAVTTASRGTGRSAGYVNLIWVLTAVGCQF